MINLRAIVCNKGTIPQDDQQNWKNQLRSIGIINVFQFHLEMALSIDEETPGEKFLQNFVSSRDMGL